MLGAFPDRVSNTTLALMLAGETVVLAACQLIHELLLEHGKDVVGLRPRSVEGLVGVVTSPLFHDQWVDLAGNWCLFVFLSFVLLLHGKKRWFLVVGGAWFLGGFLVWCTALGGPYIGLNVVVAGMLGYVVGLPFHSCSALTVLLALVGAAGYALILYYVAEWNVQWKTDVTGFGVGVVMSTHPLWYGRRQKKHGEGEKEEEAVANGTDVDESEPLIKEDP